LGIGRRNDVSDVSAKHQPKEALRGFIKVAGKYPAFIKSWLRGSNALWNADVSS
jgi:hypothetical protein